MWEMQLIALDKLKSLQDSMQEKKIVNANDVCNPHLTEIQLRLLNSNIKPASQCEMQHSFEDMFTEDSFHR
jgi:hypothetical protein